MTETNENTIPKEYIITLKGKEFITHRGLLALAHKQQLHSIETELISETTAEIIVFKATAIMGTGVHEKKFTGYGDASKENVNSMIAPHKLRMAETRAINRALRLATNVGMCSADELGGDSKVDTEIPEKTSQVPEQPQETQEQSEEKKGELHMVCIGCGKNVTEKVFKYSMDKHKMSLCYVCQKKKEKGKDYLPKKEEEEIMTIEHEGTETEPEVVM